MNIQQMVRRGITSKLNEKWKRCKAS